MAQITVLEVPINENALYLLTAQAQEVGQPIEQLAESIIEKWAKSQAERQRQGKPVAVQTDPQEQKGKMSLSEFLVVSKELKARIRQRGVEDTGDSVEILREIREERSNR